MSFCFCFCFSTGNNVSGTYNDLVVWQKSIDLVEKIYVLTAKFPKDELYGLVSQLRRAAISITSNIAEGQGRMSPGEFRQFIGHARGSTLEVETHFSAPGTSTIRSVCACVARMRRH